MRVAFICTLAGVAFADTRKWTVSPVLPNTASRIVSKSFPAFAFEESSFYTYSMDAQGNPNQFTKNLIAAVMGRTGGTPVIRVGGTSCDHGTYNASLKTPVNFPATEGGPRFDPPYLQVGPSYFKAYNSYPNAQFLFMVPLEKNNIANSVAWAKEGLAVIGDRLNALELGNEPDFYYKFSPSSYVTNFNNMRAAMVKAFPKVLANRRIFQAVDKAYNPPMALDINMVEKGLDSTGAIKQYAYHFYQHWGAISPQILQDTICNHAKTVRSMKPFAIKAAAMRARNIPFLMDEVGVSMLQGEGHNNIATALWIADYMLHNMAISVSRVHYQQIVQPGFNLWQPVKDKNGDPKVRANYYGYVFAADFIGKNANTRVNAVNIAGDRVAAYTAWDNGELKRIAIVNMNLWYAGQGSRPSTTFNIRGLAKHGYKSATVAYLTSPDGANAETSLSWNGKQWSLASGGNAKTVRSDSRTVMVGSGGGIDVVVGATEAVIVTLHK